MTRWPSRGDSATQAGTPAFCAGWSDRAFRGRDLFLPCWRVRSRGDGPSRCFRLPATADAAARSSLGAVYRSCLAVVYVVRLSSRGPPVVVLAGIQGSYAISGLGAVVVCAGVALCVGRLCPVDLGRVGSTVARNQRRGVHLIAVAATIVATSFLVRLIFPARSQQVLDLHLWCGRSAWACSAWGR